MSYVWTKGRLTRQYCGSKSQAGTLYKDTTFTYDAYGRRTAKSYAYDPNPISNSDYSYTYDTTYDYDNSGRLVREYCTEKYISGTTTKRELIYLYDESGIIGVMYSLNGATSTPYFYRRNLQGDVTAIYNSSGTKVGEYAYDAWGNCTILSGIANDLVKNNPIRYRGYYFDRETGIYYLNARYYNPQWRRFISPDDSSYLDPETPNGLNLYAYCNNDPVNYADPSGRFAISLATIGAIVLGIAGAVTGGVIAHNIAKDNGAEGWDLVGYTALGVLGGGLIGAVLGYGAGALITKATSILGFSIFKGHVFTITQTIVLGHYGYVDIANSLGYSYYEISKTLYDSLNVAERWAMNSQFLDDCSKLGANFLVEATRTISPMYNGNISFLYYEIQYLLEKGYVWLEDLYGLIKP